jgi:5'-3' exonuclease
MNTVKTTATIMVLAGLMTACSPEPTDNKASAVEPAGGTAVVSEKAIADAKELAAKTKEKAAAIKAIAGEKMDDVAEKAVVVKEAAGEKMEVVKDKAKDMVEKTETKIEDAKTMLDSFKK